jgi:hypothetical protein
MSTNQITIPGKNIFNIFVLYFLMFPQKTLMRRNTLRHQFRLDGLPDMLLVPLAAAADPSPAMSRQLCQS